MRLSLSPNLSVSTSVSLSRSDSVSEFVSVSLLLSKPVSVSVSVSQRNKEHSTVRLDMSILTDDSTSDTNNKLNQYAVCGVY